MKCLATRDYILLHSYCKWLMNIVPVYKQSQVQRISITGVRTLIYTCKFCARLCVKCHSCECQLFGLWISKMGKFLLKLRVHRLEKFAPWENNLLYDNHLTVYLKNDIPLDLAEVLHCYMYVFMYMYLPMFSLPKLSLIWQNIAPYGI